MMKYRARSIYCVFLYEYSAYEWLAIDLDDNLTNGI